MNSLTGCDDHDVPLDIDCTEPAAELPDESMLYVAIVDAGLQLRAGLQVEITGAEIHGAAMTDEYGVLFLDGCPPGSYTLFAASRSATVHTLTQSDLERCPEPYLSILR